VRPFAASLIAAFLAVLAGLGCGAADAQEPPAAIRIAPDVTASGTVVGLGRDVVLEGRALAGVTVLRASVRVAGEVRGDVVVLGGNATLDAGARVSGDVLVFGGGIDSVAGAVVEGRSAAYPAVARSWLVLAEGPALGLSPFSRAVLGAKSALLLGWTLLVAVLLLTAERGVVVTAGSIGRQPLQGFAIGIAAVMAMIAAAILIAGFLDGLIGVPVLVLLVVAALVLKLWGVVACCCWLGSRVGAKGRWVPGDALRHAFLGLAILGVVKFVPWVGTWTWTAASLVGIGATLATKFGRDEPWLVGRGGREH